jgi:hypothetical protein
MGAWSETVFDNDDAMDFAAGLRDAPSWQTVAGALNRALTADYLEAPEAAAALAAGAFVAAANSGDLGLVPHSHALLVARLGPVPAGLGERATEAFERVTNDSELAELWAEGDAGGSWLAAVAAISAKLT